MIHPGLVSVTFRQLSVEEIVALCVAQQLRGIEWGGDIHVPAGNIEIARRVQRLTHDAGLAVSAYGSYYRLGQKDGGFVAVLESAVALKAPFIRVWAGLTGSSDATPDDWEKMVEDAVECARLAGREGIDLALEFHGGTLNDTNEAALKILDQLTDEKVRTHWQPLNHYDEGYRAEGLAKLLPHLASIHVFNWSMDGRDRYPLEAARPAWQRYLDLAAKSPRDHYALLEFVEGDTVENLPREAATLREILHGAAAE